MKAIKFIAVGFLFGLFLTKTEAVSWYRIFEMFRFQSFHMYGVIGVAVSMGLIGVQLMKKYKTKDIHGEVIVVPEKEKGNARYWIGGILFGLGWALAGTCPGPIFILIGAGYLPVLIVLLGALIGTFIYGLLKDKLPH